MTDTTREMRAFHVQQVNANMSISGILADEFSLALQQRYIDGEISVEQITELTRTAFEAEQEALKAGSEKNAT